MCLLVQKNGNIKEQNKITYLKLSSLNKIQLGNIKYGLK